MLFIQTAVSAHLKNHQKLNGMKRIIKFFKIIGIVLISIIIIAFLYIVINSKLGNSKIYAEIDGFGTKLLAVSYNSIDRTESHYKLAFCFNDKVNIKIPHKRTGEVIIKPVIEAMKRKVFRSKNISFYLDPNSEIIIKGKSKDISVEYEIIKGNKLSFQRNELNKTLLPYYEKESRLIYESFKLRKTNPEKSNLIIEQFDSLRFFIVAPLRTEWAKEHLDYELTPVYFLESHVPKDTVKKYFNLLQTNVRESEYGQILEKTVLGWNNTQKGDIAPNFEQYTNLKKHFSLAELKGKYVIIDFWGSWCGPCISEMPKMKKYYEKYNDKIEFVGIACNDRKDSWEKFIKDNQLNWVHLLNDVSKNDISALYGVTSYPTKFILDKEGGIIEKFEGIENDFYKVVDEIIKR